jgi:hypothetical protein
MISARRLALAAAVAAALLGSGCIHNEDEVANGVVSGERPVAMEGSQDFLGGKLAVRVTLARGMGRGVKRSKDQGKSYNAFVRSDGSTEIGSTVPPVTLHLLVTNRDSVSVKVHLIDFNSDLGNFAIDPDTLALDPGATGEPTTMVSNLGVTSDEIPFTVTLKVGSVRESRTVVVRNLRADSAGPSPAQ